MLRLVTDASPQTARGMQTPSSLPATKNPKILKNLKILVASTYKDGFDWGLYDRIGAKFSTQQPRGGVVFRSGLKLVNHYESCTRCHYALEIDTYGRGCTHNCVYCYSKEILTRHGYWNEPQPFPLDFSELRKVFYYVFETDRKNKWRELLEKKIPLRLGAMSDCFMWLDRSYRVTYELLKMLRHYAYPYIIFTRSDLVAHEDYLNVMDPRFCAIQLSMSGDNEKLTRLIEPGAPSIARRLAAIQTLTQAGFWTTVRINPLFPIHPDGYFTDRASIEKRFGNETSAPTFPLFSWEFLSRLAEVGTPSLLAGFVRLSPFAIRALEKQTQVPLSQFFKPELFSRSSDSSYSDPEIRHYYAEIAKRCKSLGIRFSTCYIGQGVEDYFQYQRLWDNKRDCCDARGNVPHMKASSQDISWATRLEFSNKKEVAQEVKQLDANVAAKYERPFKVVSKYRGPDLNLPIVS